jgi:hypothetical protein
MKLIAGIDPGTTVGWAVFDLNGKVVALGSQKELDLDSVVSKSTAYGKIILVGSDKAKIPSFVEDVGTKCGAKVIGPAQDVRVDEKRNMTRLLSFQNSHEMDALASGLIAFKKFHPLLNKIRLFLEKEKRLSLFEDVAELVIKEEISIRAAIAILTPQEEVKEIVQEEQKRDEDISQLFSMLSRVRKDNSMLLSRNRELEKYLFGAEQNIKTLKEKAASLVRPKTPVEIAKIKDTQIQSLSQRLKNSLQTQSQLMMLIERLEKTLLQQDKIPVLRLAWLGWDEVMKNKEFITEGNVLYVDDANQMSENAVNWLHEKGIQIVICGKLPGSRARAQLPFACIPSEECELFSRIVLVKRSWLDKVRAERTVLAKIVEEYKKERLPGNF